jgi:hypothetical protein
MVARDANGRFVAGESANPGGRPKSELSITALIDKAMTEADWLFIIEAQIKRARRGDQKSIEWLTDRRFGKALQATEISGKGGGAIEVIHVRAGDNDD